MFGSTEHGRKQEICWPEKKKIRSAELNNSDFKEMNGHTKESLGTDG